MDRPRQGCAVLEPAAQTRPRQTPLWHVVLLDDDDHTYEYVVEMLVKLFRHQPEHAYEMACEVDHTGRVIVTTTVFEQAEFKRGQVHAYGRDWRLEHSHGSMRAVLEPATSEDP